MLLHWILFSILIVCSTCASPFSVVDCPEGGIINENLIANSYYGAFSNVYNNGSYFYSAFGTIKKCNLNPPSCEQAVRFEFQPDMIFAIDDDQVIMGIQGEPSIIIWNHQSSKIEKMVNISFIYSSETSTNRVILIGEYLYYMATFDSSNNWNLLKININTLEYENSTSPISVNVDNIYMYFDSHNSLLYASYSVGLYIIHTDTLYFELVGYDQGNSYGDFFIDHNSNQLWVGNKQQIDRYNDQEPSIPYFSDCIVFLDNPQWSTPIFALQDIESGVSYWAAQSKFLILSSASIFRVKSHPFALVDILNITLSSGEDINSILWMEVMDDNLYVGVFTKRAHVYVVTFGGMKCTLRTSKFVWIAFGSILGIIFFVIFGLIVKKIQHEQFKKEYKKIQSNSSDEEVNLKIDAQ